MRSFEYSGNVTSILRKLFFFFFFKQLIDKLVLCRAVESYRAVGRRWPETLLNEPFSCFKSVSAVCAELGEADGLLSEKQLQG